MILMHDSIKSIEMTPSNILIVEDSDELF